MDMLSSIRMKVKALYESDPNIHVNVFMSRPTVSLSNESVMITEVYPHLFRVKESRTGKEYSIQYSELLTNQVQISELGSLSPAINRK